MAEATANSLRASVEQPLLGSPKSPQRHVEWELNNVVLTHLRVIGKVWESAVLSPAALADVRPFVADALRSVQKFVQQLDWTGSERNLGRENEYLLSIFEEIEQIHNNDDTRKPLTRHLVEALGKTCKTCMFIRHVYTIPEMLTSSTVAEAAVHSLQASVEKPYLGSPLDSQRHVEWELDNVVLAHLSILRKVLGSQVVSSDTLADIHPFLIDALCSIQKFVREMDWDGSKRDLDGEARCFTSILWEIERICGDGNTCDAINPPLVEALANTCKACTHSIYSTHDH